MSTQSTVRRVAIVGTGTIGARGLGRRHQARLSPGASPDRLTFAADMRQAVADADFVQENAPERPGLKVKLFADIDDAAPPDAIIASGVVQGGKSKHNGSLARGQLRPGRFRPARHELVGKDDPLWWSSSAVVGERFVAKFAWSRPAALRVAHEIGILTAPARGPRVKFRPSPQGCASLKNL